jgi:SsrA-binding protein
MVKTKENIDIKNRKASFEYRFLDKYTAGIQLYGTEIKSIRESQANINDAFCSFNKNELFVKGMHIGEYKQGSYNNHQPKRERKLLLNKTELEKLHYQLKDKGLTIVPLRLFVNEKGLAKLEIALAKGKKTFDKREDIKKRDTERETMRKLK